MTVHIGISGAIAAGKSTLSAGLAALYTTMNIQTEVIPFASGLKYLAGLYTDPNKKAKAYDYFRTLGVDAADAMLAAGRLIRAFTLFPTEEGVKNRKLLQYIGTELGRDSIAKDIWIKDVKQRLVKINPAIVISDDVRFINESETIDIHVAIIAVTPKAKDIYAQRLSLLPVGYVHNDHPSEQERFNLRSPDFTIEVGFLPADVINLGASILDHLYMERIV